MIKFEFLWGFTWWSDVLYYLQCNEWIHIMNIVWKSYEISKHGKIGLIDTHHPDGLHHIVYGLAGSLT